MKRKRSEARQRVVESSRDNLADQFIEVAGELIAALLNAFSEGERELIRLPGRFT